MASSKRHLFRTGGDEADDEKIVVDCPPKLPGMSRLVREQKQNTPDGKCGFFGRIFDLHVNACGQETELIEYRPSSYVASSYN